MYIHEYGDPAQPTLVLLHPMEITGENLYQILSPFLEGQYHILAPDQGGHGKSGPYTDCRAEAAALEQGLLERGCREIDLLYGASMGVCTAYELLKKGTIPVRKIWFDGGGLAPDARIMNWIMKTMFLKKHRTLVRNPEAPATNLIRMYGEDFASLMKENFLQLSEQDLVRICYDCSHRLLAPVSPEMQRKIHFEYGQGDPNLKAARKIIRKWFPESGLTVREGYGHCGYMAFHSKEYVREMEAFLNQD